MAAGLLNPLDDRAIAASTPPTRMASGNLSCTKRNSGRSHWRCGGAPAVRPGWSDALRSCCAAMIAYVLLTRFEVHDNSPSNPEADATIELATPARGITDAVTGPGSFINLRYQDFKLL